REGQRLALFHGAGGELAGFAIMHVDHLVHEGRSHAIVTGGFMFRTGYRGGATAVRFALLEALRPPPRAPFSTFLVVTRANSPTSYRLFASLARTIWPARGVDNPPWLESLLRRVIDRHGMVPVEGSCWIVRQDAAPRSTDRFENAAEEDPYMRFFLE